jgi:AraC-like DNA-binding protein
MMDFQVSSSHRADTLACHYYAVERVIGAMLEHLDDSSFSLEDMATVAIMSPYHFNRSFRQLTGVPPCRFLGALRLEAAKRLLLTTQVSVTNVCFEVGYNSLGTFVRRFTELLGLSPGRLRLMAQTPMDAVLYNLRHASYFSEVQVAPSLFGQVTAPQDFCGSIFIGLFATSIPQGNPVACTVTSQPGPYHVTPVPNGRFYLFTAGLAWSEDPREYFLCESVLRGGGQLIRVCDGDVKGSTDLSLRPPTSLDPPLLLTFPLLLAKRMQEERFRRLIEL